LVGDAFVLAEQEADLPAAHPDVAGRDIGVGSDMPVQLSHEALAEAHHFIVALALGIEIRSAFGAAHGQRGERIFEGLLESQKLQNAQVDGRVEAQPAFVRSDCAVHLDAKTAVDLHHALVVDPGDAEHDHALGLDDPVKDAGGNVFRVSLDHGPQRIEHFLDGLVKFGFRRIFCFHLRHDFFNVIARHLDCGRVHNSSTHCVFSSEAALPFFVERLFFWQHLLLTC
jgi:hypothetical protein